MVARGKKNFWQEDAKPKVLKLLKELLESTVEEDLIMDIFLAENIANALLKEMFKK